MADPTLSSKPYQGKPRNPEEPRNHGYSSNGDHPHPLYEAWCGMIARCENANHASYKNYGARGIKVCDRWRQSFPTFLADILSEIGERPKGHTLDRIDNDGHYEPGNIRWATRRTQNRNSRHAKLNMEEARVIREIYATRDKTTNKNGASVMLANAYGVSRHHIWQIVNNMKWKE